MERQGIATVCLQLLREAAKAVRPPRSLFLPFRHGYPLDVPNDPVRQRRVIDAAFDLVYDETLAPPVLVDYPAKQVAVGR